MYGGGGSMCESVNESVYASVNRQYDTSNGARTATASVPSTS